tara:strand:- start:943 stop:1788 length:846 start_codon:yes stop_codon:yes gene_type:complete
MDYLPLIREALVNLNFKASFDNICDEIGRLEHNAEENFEVNVKETLIANSHESDIHKMFRKLLTDQNTLWELIVCPTGLAKEKLKKLAIDLERDEYLEESSKLDCFANEIRGYLDDSQIEYFLKESFREVNNIWTSYGLTLYKKFNRNDVREIFDPSSPKGRWKVPSYLPLSDNDINNGAAFFSTVGAAQAGIEFNDALDTNEGTFIWDCQPNQDRESNDIQFMIHSNEDFPFHLFYRLSKKEKYIYLGRLKYVSHQLDTRPGTDIAIKWKLLDNVNINTL